MFTILHINDLQEKGCGQWEIWFEPDGVTLALVLYVDVVSRGTKAVGVNSPYHVRVKTNLQQDETHRALDFSLFR